MQFDDLYMGGRVELNGEYGIVYRDEAVCEILWDYTNNPTTTTRESTFLADMRSADAPENRDERLAIIRGLERDGVLAGEAVPELVYWHWSVNDPEKLPVWLLWQYQRYGEVRWYGWRGGDQP